jgi:hypothetical protein
MQLLIVFSGGILGVIAAVGTPAKESDLPLQCLATLLGGIVCSIPFFFSTPLGALRPEALLSACSMGALGIAIRSLEKRLSLVWEIALCTCFVGAILSKQQGVTVVAAVIVGLLLFERERRQRVLLYALISFGIALAAILGYNKWSGGALWFWCFELPSKHWKVWDLWWKNVLGVGRSYYLPLTAAIIAGLTSIRLGVVQMREIAVTCVILLTAFLLGLPLAGKIGTVTFSAFSGVAITLYLLPIVWGLRVSRRAVSIWPQIVFAILCLDVCKLCYGASFVNTSLFEPATTKLIAEVIRNGAEPLLISGDPWIPYSATETTVYYPESINDIQLVADEECKADYLLPLRDAIKNRVFRTVVVWTIPGIESHDRPESSWNYFAYLNRKDVLGPLTASGYVSQWREEVSFPIPARESGLTKVLRAMGMIHSAQPAKTYLEKNVFEILKAP